MTDVWIILAWDGMLAKSVRSIAAFRDRTTAMRFLDRISLAEPDRSFSVQHVPVARAA